MIVTNHDIASGRLAILPVGWQEYGSAAQALAASRLKWFAEDAERKLRGELPSGWGLIHSANTQEAVVHEFVVKERRAGAIVLDTLPGDPDGSFRLRSVPMDFDVVDLVEGKVLARARRPAAPEVERPDPWSGT